MQAAVSNAMGNGNGEMENADNKLFAMKISIKVMI